MTMKCTILADIRDALKDVHIEDGTNNSFDRVCNDLADRLSMNKVFTYGEKQGKQKIQSSLKELLDIQE